MIAKQSRLLVSTFILTVNVHFIINRDTDKISQFILKNNENENVKKNKHTLISKVNVGCMWDFDCVQLRNIVSFKPSSIFQYTLYMENIVYICIGKR